MIRMRVKGGTGLLAMVLAGSALGQSTAPQEGVLQEIIVTAQKREQRLQDVPVSVTVLGAEALERASIDSGTEIARQTPNLRVSVLGDESQPKFALRGVSTPEFNLNAISPTGVFFDEVYVGASFLGGAQIYDIERVEVLRGPQGTLFGKNTTAGAINFISAAPRFEREAELTAGYGSHGYVELKGVGEVPLVENRLSMRFAFAGAHSDGYVDNLNPAGHDLSNIDRKSGRLSLAYQDESGFDGTLRLFVVHNDARAIGAINEGLGPNGTNAFGINPRINPFTGARLSNHEVVTDRSGVIEVRGKGGYLTLNKDFGSFTLTSISSLIDGRFLNLVDGDGSIANLLHIDFGSETQEISQDLRIATSMSGPFQLIAGVYYYQDDIDVRTVYRLFGGPPIFPVLAQTYNQKRESIAGYVDGTLDWGGSLSFYGGVRYTDDKGRIREFQVDPIIPPQPKISYHDGEPTGRIGVRFKFSPDVMTYAQFSRGYRSSAINGGALTNPADLNVARPETLDAYEIGIKSQAFERRLTLNASAFLYDFSDQQFINVVGIGNQQLVNAGRSRIKGAEIECSVNPTGRFSLSAGLGLLDSEYRELVLNGVDLSGNDLIEAPKHTLNFAGDYALPLRGSGEIAFHADATQVASQYFSATNAPEFRVGSFWDVGARVTWTDARDRFAIAAYGKNLTDNDEATGVQTDPSTLTRFTTVPYPRRYGVELTARF
jgi:iron complex outermembrane receptor protein